MISCRSSRLSQFIFSKTERSLERLYIHDLTCLI
uniref:Uncharacterized protein n=1 Tax=Rhizophora mucronata TaxID=61149 RepID=A0A2P2PFF5_RHIMU